MHRLRVAFLYLAAGSAFPGCTLTTTRTAVSSADRTQSTLAMIYLYNTSTRFDAAHLSSIFSSNPVAYMSSDKRLWMNPAIEGMAVDWVMRRWSASSLGGDGEEESALRINTLLLHHRRSQELHPTIAR